jgi:hypothetical protein
MTIIAAYKAAPEFTQLANDTRRAYLNYIKLIEEAFGDLSLAALADRRVRGEFKAWRDTFPRRHAKPIMLGQPLLASCRSAKIVARSQPTLAKKAVA